MERNWLIRTTQKQILGPIAKSKVLEFLQKGALGINDEVTSGNGYWFSLKEKDLVDKYLYGDVPQSYNPISESKSVLSKRENPDKTTSLNATPANKTQVLKVGTTGPGAIPASSDLEYPDLDSPDLTMIGTIPSAQPYQAPLAAPAVSAAPVLVTPPSVSSALLEEMKMPTSEDLEFPDVSLITASVNNSPKAEISHGQSIGITPSPAISSIAIASNEPVIYPDDGDLAYPEMGGLSTGISAPNLHAEIVQEVFEEERDFKVDLPTDSSPKIEVKKSVSRDFKNEVENDSGLSLATETYDEKNAKSESVLSLHKEKKQDKNKAPFAHNDDKMHLRERKVKASHHPSASPEGADNVARSTLPEHLKKRNDNYLMYVLVILVLIILSLFFYYYRTILNKPLPV